MASIFITKLRALISIDAAAEGARRTVITDIAGQSDTYAAKRVEAASFIAAKLANPAALPGPYLTADVAENGGDAVAKANAIVAASNDYLVNKDPMIEAKRIGGKARVRAASTVDDVEAERVAAVAAINALLAA